jgi:hypothetical protein
MAVASITFTVVAITADYIQLRTGNQDFFIELGLAKAIVNGNDKPDIHHVVANIATHLIISGTDITSAAAVKAAIESRAFKVIV